MSLRKWTIHHSIFTITAIASIACAADMVSDTELVGRYTLNDGSQDDQLILRNDGHYVHLISGLDAFADSSTWVLEDIGGQQNVNLKNFRARGRSHPDNLIQDAKASQTYGVYSLVVDRSFTGVPKLMVSLDLNVAYVRSFSAP